MTFAKLLLLFALTLQAQAQTHIPKSPGNRLVHLNDPSPFYPHRNFPKLTTPQWVGERGVEAVVTLGIDDMRTAAVYEQFLRPILERLKKIDGRAPVSIMTCRIPPDDPQVQTWLKEGVTIEVHTLTHPCPLLHKGNFEQAANVVHGGVDLLSQIKGNKPVAYRMPCCDSMNSLSPRFFAEIFNKNSTGGRFLKIDSSAFNITTSKDKSLPRNWVLDKEGKERFGKYLEKMKSYVGTIEDYPYPYVINRLCWEFPCLVPSDWEAQNLIGNKQPQMLEDWKRALDVTVRKQGVMNLVFHPHGWSSSAQLVSLIDYANKTYGKKVKFLNFKECVERLEKNLLKGSSLRDKQGHDAGARVMDINNDGYMDVLITAKKTTRIWNPEQSIWRENAMTFDPRRFAIGVLDKSQAASLVYPTGNSTIWSFQEGKWKKTQSTKPMPEADRKGFLRDVDNDGISEWLGTRILRWNKTKGEWTPVTYTIPDGINLTAPSVRFIDLNGDGFDDLVFSNNKRWGIYLWETRVNAGLGWKSGWSHVVHKGKRGDKDAIPMISRGGKHPNNGTWFHSEHLWVQNENTAHMPQVVDRRSFKQLLDFGGPKAKEPEASRQCFQVREGFEVRLVANEPQVRDPVAFDWGADGKLWVAEMGDYPLGTDGKGKRGGVVRWLVDGDDDGHYEKSTVFLDGLNFPNGVMPWGKGVLISAAPDIIYAEDTTGDGRADVHRTLFTGFREGNQQHRMNGFCFGLDNWIYAANGDSGGIITSKTTGKSVNINGLDFRFKITGEFETVAGQTQFGRWRDDWGNWFGNNNPNWLWHYHVPIRYFARNPQLALPATRRNTFTNNRLFPISTRMERPNSPNAYGHVTSANSASPYRGGLFAKVDPSFARSIFISEPVHNLVHREVLEPVGVSFRGHRAKGEEKSEFLASTDNWFRPTQIKTGPDGALYVADMYRLIIEHPEWIPAAMQSRVDLRAGHDRGRIWKVFPKNAKLRPFPRLDKLTGAQLAYVLDSPNGWQRDQAQRLLLDHKDPKTHQPLAFMATNRLHTKVSPQTRIHALHTLAGLGALKDETLKAALRDVHPAVREHAVRLCEGGHETLTRQCLTDKSPRVRRQVAFSLGNTADPKAAEALVQLAHDKNTDVRLAVKSSVTPHLAEMLRKIFASGKQPPQDITSHLLKLATSGNNQEALAQVLTEMSNPKFRLVKVKMMSGFLDTLNAQGQTLAVFHGKANARLKKAINETKILFTHARNNPRDSLAIPLLTRGLSHHEADRLKLINLLNAKEPPAIQKIALATLSRGQHPKLTAQLLKGWSTYGPSTRAGVIGTLLTRELWTQDLLATVEKGKLSTAQISPGHRQKLSQHPKPAIRSKATKLFGQIDPNRAKIIASYQKVSKLQGDTKRGAELYKVNCAVCHKFRNEGNPVGPDLATLTGKPTNDWLTAILDPNRAVEDKYIGYVITTRANAVHTGVISVETPTSLTLRTLTGQEQVILRTNIKALQSTGLSLMPLGLEVALTPQGIADLLSHLRSK